MWSATPITDGHPTPEPPPQGRRESQGNHAAAGPPSRLTWPARASTSPGAVADGRRGPAPGHRIAEKASHDLPGSAAIAASADLSVAAHLGAVDPAPRHRRGAQ